MVKTKTKDFNGLGIVAFESRLSEVMEKSISRFGGKPLVAPSMQEIQLTKCPEVFSFAEKLFAGEIDILLLMTGVGTRMLIQTLETKYPQVEIIKALQSVTMVARGPKPVKALTEYKLSPTFTVPEPNTWHEIIEELETSRRGLDLEDKTIAIQEYGIPNETLIETLKKLKVNVVRVPIYRWALPDDRKPLLNAIQEIIAGKMHLALITSAIQLRHVLQVASEQGVEKPFREAFQKLVVCSIGPTSTEAIRESGFSVDFEPSHPKMGQLVGEAAQQAVELVREKQSVRRPTLELKERRVSLDERAKTQRESIFLKACRREVTSTTPVWLMRQAGRYMKEYRRIRDKVTFLELCKNKQLAAEVTITAQEKIGADAAIIFSDILLIVESLGLHLEYGTGDGPAISGLSISSEKIDNLPEIKRHANLS